MKNNANQDDILTMGECMDIAYINKMQETEEFINDMERYNREIYMEEKEE